MNTIRLEDIYTDDIQWDLQWPYSQAALMSDAAFDVSHHKSNDNVTQTFQVDSPNDTYEPFDARTYFISRNERLDVNFKE